MKKNQGNLRESLAVLRPIKDICNVLTKKSIIMCEKMQNLNGTTPSNNDSNLTFIIRENFNYKVLIEISTNNKNYGTLKKINNALNSENQSWKWLIENSGINEFTMKTYFGGQEYISLKTIEKIVPLFVKEMVSPRYFMDLKHPVLKGGQNYDLNIKQIMDKYRINRGDLVIATGIASGNLSNYINGKNKQLRIETLTIIFNFFKSRGVPLRNIADLIYFKNHNEKPLHFLEDEKVKGLIPKFHTNLRIV